MTINVSAYAFTRTIDANEWSMTTDTAGPDVTTVSGIYQAVIDFSALLVGDGFEFRLYEKAISGGTQRLTGGPLLINGVQTVANWISPSFILGIGWDMTLKKVTGTDRSLSWSIRAVT